MRLTTTKEVYEHVCDHGMHVKIEKENGRFVKATFPSASNYTPDQWKDIKELATIVCDMVENDTYNLGGLENG